MHNTRECCKYHRLDVYSWLSPDHGHWIQELYSTLFVVPIKLASYNGQMYLRPKMCNACNHIHKLEWPTKVSLVWPASADMLDIKYPKYLLSVRHLHVDLLPSSTDIELVPTCRYLTLHFVGTRTYKIICRLHRCIQRGLHGMVIFTRQGLWIDVKSQPFW